MNNYSKKNYPKKKILQIFLHQCSRPSLVCDRNIVKPVTNFYYYSKANQLINHLQIDQQFPFIERNYFYLLLRKIVSVGIIGQIVDALNEFRNAVVDSINAQTAAKADAQQEHEEYLEQLDAEFAEFQKQINRVNVDLTATYGIEALINLEKIDQLSEFRDQREADKKQYTAEFELENNTYVEETDIYTNLENELTIELGISEQAQSVEQSADFKKILI